ncbi:methyltransferase family protein [Saprospira grandis DSM 2844]|uniref:Methyltransferase family protein n=1 Tax=Saprospira grandis DSM 2844 TaxID=694433 RepID=J0P900_9BACT|nr:class I SAM-dependent methyltransferase [Saprospira grandis]EJF54042.1 methyltransferase family protein [Saprospira grandis DSM 2844]
MNYQEQILANKAVWEQRAALHPETEFYQQDAFMQGQTSLQSIERSLLATDLSGKRVLHLQCHFGQDSLSLARMGAEVVGLDLSETAIAKAQSLAKALNLNARFYQGNVLDAQEVLAQEAPFDLIFCSYGVVYWLPDLLQWGQEIGPLLKRGGEFMLVEFHPIVWMFDDNFSYIQYSYFDQGAIETEEEGSYANREAEILGKSYGWNHSLSEMTAALTEGAGWQLSYLKEYKFSPYNCFNNTVAHPKGYQIKGLEDKIPMVFALGAQRP